MACRRGTSSPGTGSHRTPSSCTVTATARWAWRHTRVAWTSPSDRPSAGRSAGLWKPASSAPRTRQEQARLPEAGRPRPCPPWRPRQARERPAEELEDPPSSAAVRPRPATWPPASTHPQQRARYPAAPADETSKLIIAAGRLIPVKRYDLLIDAFAKVAAQRPDWGLRLYGRGPQRQALRTQIDQLGLHERVHLMGAVSPIETEWVKGSIAGVTSSVESFGLTIVEAMRAGIPIVSTDCLHGPREIITHGRDGLLATNGDPQAIADALLRLIDDGTLRRTMGRAALHTARTYQPDRAATRYESLITELKAHRTPFRLSRPRFRRPSNETLEPPPPPRP
ncbi:glycosyltransferase [Nonomuraea thailandensis]